MLDARGEMKVMDPSRAISIHFRESGKLRGFSGSSCDSHPTMPLSRSESGSSAGAMRAFLLLEVRFVAIRDNLLFVLALVSTRSSPSSTGALGPALIDAVV
jgi:hypothetical protein